MCDSSKAAKLDSTSGELFVDPFQATFCQHLTLKLKLKLNLKLKLKLGASLSLCCARPARNLNLPALLEAGTRKFLVTYRTSRTRLHLSQILKLHTLEAPRVAPGGDAHN